MGPAFNRTDLTYAEFGCGSDVFQAPVFFDAQEFDAVAESLAEAILRCPTEAKSFDGIGHRGPELSEAERFGEVVEGFAFEGSAHVIEGRVAGDDDYAERGPAGEELVEHLFSLKVAHFHIEEDDVGKALFGGEKQVFGVGESANGKLLILHQYVFHIIAEVVVVVEHGNFDESRRRLNFHTTTVKPKR